MDRTDQSLIAIRRILRSTEMYAHALAKAAGLTPAQIRVLQIVAKTGQATPTEISRRMRVSPPTMTSLIGRLVAKGMVERRPSDVDRRQTNVVVTELGLASVRKAPDPLQQKYVSQFEALESWEQGMIVAALERVAAMLDTTSMDAAPVLDARTLDDDVPPAV